MTRKQLIPILCLAAMLLSACGIKGDLQAPPPLLGDKSGKVEPASPEVEPSEDPDYDPFFDN